MADLPEVTDIDSERSFLGACLRGDADALAELVNRLEPEDFTEPLNRTVAAAIVELSRAGNPHGPAEVLAALREAGAISYRNGDLGPYLHTLYSAALVPACGPYNARAMRQATLRRRVQQMAVRLTDAAENAGTDELRKLLDTEREAVARYEARIEVTS